MQNRQALCSFSFCIFFIYRRSDEPSVGRRKDQKSHCTQKNLRRRRPRSFEKEQGMKKSKDQTIRELREEIKYEKKWAEESRQKATQEMMKADSYRKCLQEILCALGEHGATLSHRWIGQKIGEMLKWPT
jgi:hypothetical protein